MAESYIRYYATQARGTQFGGGAGEVIISNIHKGPRFQRGYGIGGIFANLFRRVLPFLKDTARDAGKQLLKAGLDTASDGLRGENVRLAAKRNFENAGRSIGTEVIDKMKGQLGDGERPRKRKKLATVQGPRKAIKGVVTQDTEVIRHLTDKRKGRASKVTKADLFGIV
jgi:hypothetical protein